MTAHSLLHLLDWCRHTAKMWPLRRTAGALQAAVDQFLPEPLRELFAVAKLPPIAAVTAHGFLAVNLHVTTGGAPQAPAKRKQLGVLADARCVRVGHQMYRPR